MMRGLRLQSKILCNNDARSSLNKEFIIMTSLLSDKITDVRATRHSHQQMNSENSRGYDTVKATMETDPHRSSNSPSCGEHCSIDRRPHPKNWLHDSIMPMISILVIEKLTIGFMCQAGIQRCVKARPTWCDG